MGDSNAGPKKKKSFKRFVKYVLIYLGVMCLIAATAWFGWGMYWSSQIRGELQRIKDAGEPLSFEQLAAGRPSLDVKDNAGPVYQQAMDMFIERDIDLHPYLNMLKDDKGIRRQPSESDLAALTKLLDDQADLLALIDQAAGMKNCELDLGWQTGFSKYFTPVFRLTQLNSIRCSVLVFNGRSNDAVSFVNSSFQFQRLFDRNPLLISELLRASNDSIACDDIQLILNNSHFNNHSLMILMDTLPNATANYQIEELHRGVVFGGEWFVTVGFLRLRRGIDNPPRY